MEGVNEISAALVTFDPDARPADRVRSGASPAALFPQPGSPRCAGVLPSGYQGLVVWRAAGPKPYQPNPIFTQYRDLAGNTVQITKGTPVSIDAKPLLFDSNAPSN